MRRGSWQTHFLVLVAYLLLALALTWPLAIHFPTHVPGNGVDDPPLTWNLWWVRYTLLDLQANPFASDYLFHPLGINLAFYTLTLLNGLLSIPLQAVTGLIPASNLLLLFSFVLGGYGAFLLAAYLLRRGNSAQGAGLSSWTASNSQMAGSLMPAAFVAGLVYAFASSKMFYAALGQWNIASSQWIPFYVLYLWRLGDHPRQWRNPLLAGLFLLFQAYAELTYATFLVLFTVGWLAWRVARHLLGRTRATSDGSADLRRVLVNLAVMAALFGLGLAPMLAMMIPDLRAEGDILVQGAGFADVFSADLLGFLVPTLHHPLFGSLVQGLNLDHTVGQHLYLGYSLLGLLALGILLGWRRPGFRFWLVSVLVFWLLTLGPALRIDGRDTGLPLPFVLVSRLPFFQGNRYPSRYSVLLFLSLAMTVAFALTEIARRCRRPVPWLRALPWLFAAAFLFEHLSAPLPLSDMRVPEVYRQIGAMPGDFALLDIPVAWRNGFRVTGTQDPIIMFSQYYQASHGKRILAGNTSRNPPLKFQYFTEAPVINTLIALETGHQVDPSVLAQDGAWSASVLRFFDIGAIVVHPQQAGPAVVPYLESTMPIKRFYADEALIAYSVDLEPDPGMWTIEPGQTLARLSYGEGWGVPAGGWIWAQRQAVRLIIPLNGGSQRMAFRAYVPDRPLGLKVELNGQATGLLDMRTGWQDYEVLLPADLVLEGLNEIWLHFDHLVPAAQVQLSSRAVGQTAVTSPVHLVVYSAGQEVGDLGHIYVNGEDVSPNERGYNVAVLDPRTGSLEQRANFDTHLDPNASRELVTFLDAVPPGKIVAVAAADEASRLLSWEAVAALGRMGAAGDLRERFRWGHAIIGVQGAPPGSALEALDGMRPVTVVVGDGLTEPWAAAAFATISFTPALP
jgi:hypothetical protein